MKGLAAFVLSASLAIAQAPTAQGGEPPKETPRVAQRAASMREQVGSGNRPVQSHVRVAVRLKNGNRLIGVVKDGMLVERVDGLRFVEAQAGEAGAGIRLWYSAGANSYVFVPFAQCAEYEVLQRLTQQQLAAIEQEMQLQQRTQAERAAALAQARETPPAPAGEGTAPADPESATAPAKGKAKPADKNDKKPDADADAAPKVEVDQQRAWLGLLQEFPPQSGWGKERRDEIARRKVVIGARPSDQEQRFVDQYDEWCKACAYFQVKTEKPQPAEEPAREAKKGRRER
jgi:hypothetical protein